MSTSTSPLPNQITSDLQDGIVINSGICGFIGITVNTLVLIVLWKKLKKGNSHTDVKICTLVSFLDVLVSFGLIFRAIFTKYPYNLFKYVPFWCKFEALAITQIINCSGYTLGVMSVERFFLICWNITFPNILWFIIIFLIISTAEIMGFIGMYNNLQYLTATEVACAVLPVEFGYYCYIITTIFFLISFITVIFSYFSIMVIKAKQCYNQINLNIPKDIVYAELRSTLTKSLIYIILYIFVFSAKFYSLFYTMITGKKRTILMDALSIILISYSPSVNSIILLYMNHEVRKDFIKLLNSIKIMLFRSNNS
jgi:hypothetical protein